MPRAEEIERTSADFKTMEAARRVPRALMEGLEALRGKPETRPAQPGKVRPLSERAGSGSDVGVELGFLPQNEAEDDEQFWYRRFYLTALDPDFSDAVSEIVGAILPRPIRLALDELSEADAAIVDEFLNNVDGNGQSLASFIVSAAEDSVAEGLSWVFVDSTAKSQPYLTHYRGKTVPYVAPVFDPEFGRTTIGEADVIERAESGDLLRKVYRRGNPLIPRQDVNRATGEGFGRYVSFRAYRKNPEGKGEEEYDDVTPLPIDGVPQNIMLPPQNLEDEDERRFVEIPLFPWYSGYRRPFFALPRILHLAHLCLLKFVKSSNFEGLLHYCSVPREQFNGTMEELVGANTVGGNTVLKSSVIATGGSDKEITVFEHSGASTGAIADSLKTLQDRIDRAAYNTMMHSAGAHELVGVAMLKEMRRATRLTADAAWWEQALEWILGRAGLYLGARGLAIPFTMPTMDPSRLLARGQSGERIERLMISEKLSVQTGLEELQRLGEVSSEVDAEDEARRLAAEVGGGL